MANRMKRGIHARKRREQAREALALLPRMRPIGDLGRKHDLACRIGEIDARSLRRIGRRLEPFARPDEHLPIADLVFRARRVRALLDARIVGIARRERLPQQEDLRKTARTMLRPEQTRRHDARLVRDEQVARPQLIDDLAEYAIAHSTALAIHHEQTARIARHHGFLGDELRWQIVIEITRFHAAHHTPLCLRQHMKRHRVRQMPALAMPPPCLPSWPGACVPRAVAQPG